jgi:predicted ATPase
LYHERTQDAADFHGLIEVFQAGMAESLHTIVIAQASHGLWADQEPAGSGVGGQSRRQHAISLELRAAMSLSRLWLRQGKRVEVRQLLAVVYNWFTEGFETADLLEARILLAWLV